MAPRRFAPRIATRAMHAASAALLVATPLAAGAQRPDADHFLLIVGNDTVAVERFSRSATTLESDLLVKQAGARMHLVTTFAPGGGATHFVMKYRQATADTASEPLQVADARFTGDSVIVDLSGSGRTATQRFATRAKALAFMNPSFALLETIVRQARAAGGDSVAVPVWNAQGGMTMPASVVRKGSDSVVVFLGAELRFAVSPEGELLGGTIPAQKARVVRVRGGGRGLSEVAKPDYSAPAGAPYTAEDVKVPSPKGHVLAGTLTLPKGRTGRVPAVVTITGSGPEDRDEAIPIVKGYRPFRQVADTLGRHGIAVLRLDDRGWGESTGRHELATSADFADDIRVALAYLRSRPEIDATRLALVGHSEGGLIAPLVATLEPSLKAIVLMAGPSQNGRTIVNYQVRNSIDRAPTLTQAQKDSALATVPAMIDSMAAKSVWAKFFFEYEPLATARKVKLPVLILQGATDQQVLAPQAQELERAFRAGGNTRVTLKVFPNANHLFVEDPSGNPAGYETLTSNVVRADVLAALVDWLTRTLR